MEISHLFCLSIFILNVSVLKTLLPQSEMLYLLKQISLLSLDTQSFDEFAVQ